MNSRQNKWESRKNVFHGAQNVKTCNLTTWTTRTQPRKVKKKARKFKRYITITSCQCLDVDISFSKDKFNTRVYGKWVNFYTIIVTFPCWDCDILSVPSKHILLLSNSKSHSLRLNNYSWPLVTSFRRYR